MKVVNNVFVLFFPIKLLFYSIVIETYRRLNFCQFYSSFPYLDDFISNNLSDIYLLKNYTFRDRNDCCYTDDLVEKIRVTPFHQTFTTRFLRFLIRGDNQMLITSSSNRSNTLNNFVLRFHQSNLSILDSPQVGSVMSAGYCLKKYYLATTSNRIQIYDEALSSLPPSLSIPVAITTIRFLHGEKMLVGTNSSTFYVYSKDASDIFLSSLTTVQIPGATNIYGFAALNQTAFYVGVNAENSSLRLFVNEGTSWNESFADRIEINAPISDLIMDNCERLWTVGATNPKLFVYEKFNRNAFEISLADMAFNLVILDNYDLVMTHGESRLGLSRIRADFNCTNPKPRTDPCLSS